MVVRYIKIIVATLTLVVVGLVTTLNIKAESQGETWLLNETLTDEVIYIDNISFISNGETFTVIEMKYESMMKKYSYFYNYNYIYSSSNGWQDEAYRIITFETSPTGELLTWLETNAVKCGGGYTQEDLDNAWADGYDAGVFTVYENGFGGIYNPYTGQLYNNENSYPYYNGYDAGVFTVYENGFGGIINPYTNEYYDNKDNYLYWLGVEDSNDFSFTGLLFQVFTGIGSILTIELLPNVTLGAIVAVPIVFGIIYFILGKRKGD